MPKNTTLLLIVWNVVLSALVVWGLVRADTAPIHTDEEALVPEGAEQVMPDPIVPRDPGALKEARIAFFFMDSVSKGYALVQESDSRLKSAGRSIQAKLENEMERAQSRYQELMQKDPTYLTEAERKKDEGELMDLQQRLQQLDTDSKNNYARMQNDALGAISKSMEDFLEDYNAKAGFDYIFSVQDGGQIWVGNKGLDITQEVINGLNERYRASKTTTKKK